MVFVRDLMSSIARRGSWGLLGLFFGPVYGCKPSNKDQLAESQLQAIGLNMDRSLAESIDELDNFSNNSDYLNALTRTESNEAQGEETASLGLINQLDSVKESDSTRKPTALLLDEMPSSIQKSLNNRSAMNLDYPILAKTKNSKDPRARLQEFFADLKKSLAPWDRSTCKILSPYFNAKQSVLMHPYFFVGFEGNAGAGVIGLLGRDFVWDFYNMQFSAFDYSGYGMTAGASSIGAEISAYFGLALGQKSDVNAAWSGNFRSASIGVGLPLLADYLSLGGSLFTGLTSSGQTDPSILGVSIGGTMSFAVPTGIPMSVSLKQAHWQASKKNNESIGQIMKRGGIPISSTGRETCNSLCLRFDSSESKASYRSRAQTLIRSIPVIASMRGTLDYFPNFNKIALLAIATGIYRDTANSAQACKFEK